MQDQKEHETFMGRAIIGAGDVSDLGRRSSHGSHGAHEFAILVL